MLTKFIKENILIHLPPGAGIQPGTVLVRKGSTKEQQGCFSHYNEDKNLVLINVLDLKEKSYIAREGVLKPEDSDSMFAYITSFRKNPNSHKALKIIREWSLFKTNEFIQEDILRFVRTTYVPEQILELKELDDLSTLFVPIQQVFRIGRFKERRDGIRVCIDRFGQWLESLNKGDHITYLSKVIKGSGDRPMFYSIGTKPHQEVEKYLKSEEFNFIPTHGGHIKCIGVMSNKKQFHVDAGSNYIGRGIKTTLSVAEDVAKGLNRTYPSYLFIPLEGRGAFGTEQSY
jgi:hypothetical protein